MLVGINYPWINYGWDFGDPPPAWVADCDLPEWRERKRTQIDDDFRGFASQGIFAVRWFLLGDGTNYGIDAYAPRETNDGWTADPLPAGHPVHDQIREDFTFILETCSKHNLKLFPSLIDFPWCQEGMAVAGNRGIIKGGRHDIIRNADKRRAFLERVLDPLLDVSVRYADSIYAWELINEPEWVVRKLSLFGEKNKNKPLSREAMKDFIREGTRRINRRLDSKGRSAFRSSVGFAHWNSLGRWDAQALGITLAQFHYYAQGNRSLPRHSQLTACPCVVGEFATAAAREWPDLRPTGQRVTDRIACAEDRGYEACFLWSARAADEATCWTDQEQQETLVYTRPRRSGDFRA